MDKHTVTKAARYLKKVDPILKRVIEAVGSVELPLQPNVFERLTRSIVGQQISRAAANSIFARLCALYPNRRKLRPEDILQTSGEELRAVGLAWSKVASLKDLAEHFVSGKIDPKKFPKMADEEIIATLSRVRGIGRWSAEMYLMFGLGRLDVLPVDDLGFRRGVEKAYRLRKQITPKKLRVLGKKWSPYSSIATFYFWRYLEGDDWTQ